MSRARLQSQNPAVTEYLPRRNLNVTIQGPGGRIPGGGARSGIDNCAFGFQHLKP
jgi:hypothetical protein